MINIVPRNYLIKLRFDEKKGVIWAAEWRKDTGWSLCEKESVRWYDVNDDFSEEDKIDLLSHFGLEDFAEEFSKSILSMSPAQLAKERRRKESQGNLRYIVIKRYGATEDYFAEDFDW